MGWAGCRQLQLVVQSQGNTWPGRADIWTGRGQDRAVSISRIATEQSIQHSTYTREGSGILQQAVYKFISRLHACGPELVNYSPSQAQGLQCTPEKTVPILQKVTRLAKFGLLPLAQAEHGMANRARLERRPRHTDLNIHSAKTARRQGNET